MVIGIYTFVKEPEWFETYLDYTKAPEEEIRKREAEREQYREKLKRFNTTVSILSLILSTDLLALSLSLSTRLAVLGDGILAGGVITLLYGVGLGIHSGGKTMKFAVASLSLVIVLGVGYFRFVPHP